MPDLVYLTGEEHAGVIGRSNDIMRTVVEWMQQAPRAPAHSGAGASQQDQSASARADAVLARELKPRKRSHVRPRDTAEAEAVWRREAIDWEDDISDHAAEHRALFTRWLE